KYSDTPPWPLAADGLGSSLQRLNPANYANDPANWVAANQSPGAVYPGGAGPTITSQPTSRTVLANSSTTFTVGVSGPGPFRYQWRFNGANIAGATDASFTVPNVQL